MSSELGLNAAPEHADRTADEGPAEQLAGQVDHADAAPDVDRVDLAQERQRLVDAELAGARHEGPDVLGQAAAAESEAGAQELAADPVVVGQGGSESFVTSAWVASQTSAIALMKEILVARKAFAETLTSSEVG